MGTHLLGIDHQRLQQFITISTWALEEVRARIADLVVQALTSQAWVIDDTAFPRMAAPRTATRRHGSRDRLTGDFIVLRVRLAGRHPRQEDGTLPACWLLTQRPAPLVEPSHYWVPSLPTDTPVDELVRLAKIRWRIEHDYRELKTALGLNHFEGRSCTGRHGHVALVTAARLFNGPGPEPPRSVCSGMTLYQAVGARQHLLVAWNDTCPTCHQPTPRPKAAPTQQSTTRRRGG